MKNHPSKRAYYENTLKHAKTTLRLLNHITYGSWGISGVRICFNRIPNFEADLGTLWNPQFDKIAERVGPGRVKPGCGHHGFKW